MVFLRSTRRSRMTAKAAVSHSPAGSAAARPTSPNRPSSRNMSGMYMSSSRMHARRSGALPLPIACMENEEL